MTHCTHALREFYFLTLTAKRVDRCTTCGSILVDNQQFGGGVLEYYSQSTDRKRAGLRKESLPMVVAHNRLRFDPARVAWRS